MIKTHDAVDTIISAMSPYTGEFMARSATQAHCKSLGLNGDQITKEQLVTLVGKLGSALNVFLGRDKSSIVVKNLHQALFARGLAL